MRIINIVLFFILLVFLTGSTALYLYEKNGSFHQWVYKQPLPVKSTFFKAEHLLIRHKIDTRWGIGLVVLALLCLFLCSSLKQKLPNMPSLGVTFFTMFALVLGSGILATIYYWPENTIHFGSLFQLKRGPREQFLQNVECIGILLLNFHLFLFLFVGFFHWLCAAGNPRKKERVSEKK